MRQKTDLVVLPQRKCKVIQFPNKRTALKVPDMTCRKTEMIDWRF